MAMLFSSIRIGEMELENRFVHSATFEGMAAGSGEVTDQILKRYRNLARGGVGLIIPGYMYVDILGRAWEHQIGIHDDSLIPGLRRLVDTVHNEGGKIVFQLAHAGRQTTRSVIGTTPFGPSSVGRDPVNFVKPRALSEAQIREVIRSFGQAAHRAAEAGADGVQIHAAHGYLVNQFLSPFFNQRKDSWGGSNENRFRFLREVLLEIRRVLPEDRAVLAKLNTDDHTPAQGVTQELAVCYARWLAELGLDALEISSGTALYSFMDMCRGSVPVPELVGGLPWWKRPLGRLVMGRLVGKFEVEEGYHLEAAKEISPQLGDTPLIVVGGWRTRARMEQAVAQGPADLISLSRPLIKEPFLIRRFKSGKVDSARCVSCNRCLAAATRHLPVRCYLKGFPELAR